ncbi:MAG: Na+/H+ antiporter NhaA [Bryobacterales bacterium]|nr:Na+/H+ antiporter NhaA [Bryobacterales bacterium]
MSLFIANLAFDERAMLVDATIGVRSASLLAGIGGAVILSLSGSRAEPARAE